MFFRNKNTYLEPLQQLYNKNKRTNNEFYIDNLLNEAIELGYRVKNFEIDEYTKKSLINPKFIFTNISSNTNVY